MLWRGIASGPTAVEQHSKQSRVLIRLVAVPVKVGNTTPVYQGYIPNIDPRLNHAEFIF